MNNVSPEHVELVRESLNTISDIVSGTPPVINNDMTHISLPRIGPDQDDISIVDRIQPLPYTSAYLSDLKTRLTTAIQDEQNKNLVENSSLAILTGLLKTVSALIV